MKWPCRLLAPLVVFVLTDSSSARQWSRWDLEKFSASLAEQFDSLKNERWDRNCFARIVDSITDEWVERPRNDHRITTRMRITTPTFFPFHRPLLTHAAEAGDLAVITQRIATYPTMTSSTPSYLPGEWITGWVRDTAWQWQCVLSYTEPGLSCNFVDYSVDPSMSDTLAIQLGTSHQQYRAVRMREFCLRGACDSVGGPGPAVVVSETVAVLGYDTSSESAPSDSLTACVLDFVESESARTPTIFISLSGDLAFTIAHREEEREPRFINIWVKEDDGQWRLRMHLRQR